MAVDVKVKRSRLRVLQVSAWACMALAVSCSPIPTQEPDSLPVAGPDHAAAIAQAREEYVLAMVQCLRRHGINASADPRGGIASSHNLAHTDYFALLDECEGDLVASGRIYPPAEPTPEYFAGAYEYNLTLKSCLEGLGFAVPEPPSKDDYIESQGAIWSPYDAVDRRMPSRAQRIEINRLCPQEYSPY